MSSTDDAIQTKFHFRGRRKNLPWYPMKGTRRHLADLFGELEFNVGAEIGTCRGEYAKVLCEANKNLRLHCVDPWMAYQGATQEKQDILYKRSSELLSKYDVVIHRQTSLDAVNDFADSSLDFVYIDGNHMFDYVVRDAIAWIPKVRRGGIVAFHDYDMTDVAYAINAYTHCHDIRPWYITREINPTAFWVNR